MDRAGEQAQAADAAIAGAAAHLRRIALALQRVQQRLAAPRIQRTSSRIHSSETREAHARDDRPTGGCRVRASHPRRTLIVEDLYMQAIGRHTTRGQRLLKGALEAAAAADIPVRR